MGASTLPSFSLFGQEVTIHHGEEQVDSWFFRVSLIFRFPGIFQQFIVYSMTPHSPPGPHRGGGGGGPQGAGTPGPSAGGPRAQGGGSGPHGAGRDDLTNKGPQYIQTSSCMLQMCHYPPSKGSNVLSTLRLQSHSKLRVFF